MGLGVFPDILGPASVAANSGTVHAVRKVLNFAGGCTYTDNPGRGRTDLALGFDTLASVSLTRGVAGEWQPNATPAGLSDVDLVRVSTTVTGVILTGFDVTVPAQQEKYVANYGSHTIDLQPPAVTLTGHAYFVDTYTLRLNETIHVVYDSVSGVYRILNAAVNLHSYLLVNGTHVAVNTNRLHVG